jgi:hypothetical protein
MVRMPERRERPNLTQKSGHIISLNYERNINDSLTTWNLSLAEYRLLILPLLFYSHTIAHLPEEVNFAYHSSGQRFEISFY